jgi:hypothetical protein
MNGWWVAISKSMPAVFWNNITMTKTFSQLNGVHGGWISALKSDILTINDIVLEDKVLIFKY